MSTHANKVFIYTDKDDTITTYPNDRAHSQVVIDGIKDTLNSWFKHQQENPALFNLQIISRDGDVSDIHNTYPNQLIEVATRKVPDDLTTDLSIVFGDANVKKIGKLKRILANSNVTAQDMVLFYDDAAHEIKNMIDAVQTWNQAVDNADINSKYARKIKILPLYVPVHYNLDDNNRFKSCALEKQIELYYLAPFIKELTALEINQLQDLAISLVKHTETFTDDIYNLQDQLANREQMQELIDGFKANTQQYIANIYAHDAIASQLPFGQKDTSPLYFPEALLVHKKLIEKLTLLLTPEQAKLHSLQYGWGFFGLLGKETTPYQANHVLKKLDKAHTSIEKIKVIDTLIQDNPSNYTDDFQHILLNEIRSFLIQHVFIKELIQGAPKQLDFVLYLTKRLGEAERFYAMNPKFVRDVVNPFTSSPTHSGASYLSFSDSFKNQFNESSFNALYNAVCGHNGVYPNKKINENAVRKGNVMKCIDWIADGTISPAEFFEQYQHFTLQQEGINNNQIIEAQHI